MTKKKTSSNEYSRDVRKIASTVGMVREFDIVSGDTSVKKILNVYIEKGKYRMYNLPVEKVAKKVKS